MGLLDFDLAFLVPDYNCGVFQVDQLVVLQPLQGEEDFVGFELILKSNYNQLLIVDTT